MSESLSQHLVVSFLLCLFYILYLEFAVHIKLIEEGLHDIILSKTAKKKNYIIFFRDTTSENDTSCLVDFWSTFNNCNLLIL